MDKTKLTGDVSLALDGQSFYSLSIAMGCICTYASYFSRQTNLTKSAVQIGVIDFLVALLAGLIIFPAAFSVGVKPDSGPSLIFITLPNVFQQAFGGIPSLGYGVSVLFYILLSMAALTSLMSLHEVSTAFLQEEMGTTRKRAALMVTVGCIVMGGVCSLSLGAWNGLRMFGMTVFDMSGLNRNSIPLSALGNIHDAPTITNNKINSVGIINFEARSIPSRTPFSIII